MEKVLVLFLLVGVLSGCLKTRAQLRDDQQEGSGGAASQESLKPVPAHPVQDVEPQGQYVIEEIKTELTHLSGRVEDLERNQKDFSGKSGFAEKEELKKLETRLTQLEESLTEISAHVGKLQESSVQNPDDVLNKAQAQYETEQYEKAADLFASYIKLPKVKHIQDASFLLAECYYKLKQYKKAIVEYSKFPEKYSHSSHMPEVLYKIALSFEALGMKEDAKGFFQELAEKYPKSTQAKKVKARSHRK